MSNQEIIDKVPDWASVVFETDSIDEVGVDAMGALLRVLKPRSIADIKRIVELEKDLNTAESIIMKTANNIIEMDNCEQDSDEMNECWDCLKEFALLATGRCDT